MLTGAMGDDADLYAACGSNEELFARRLRTLAAKDSGVRAANTKALFYPTIYLLEESK
jgi:hypothetical protein